MGFQLTASRRGWQCIHQLHRTILAFQLTASRRGWLQHGCWNPVKKSISTHSLTKRLTGTLCLYDRIRNISTHSLTKRLTDLSFFLIFSYPTFQLTASRRGWHQHNSDARNSDCISTHSLTKRLTDCIFVHLLEQSHFNSQPHEEADADYNTIKGIEDISTHSLTKRLTFDISNTFTGFVHFNSQPHEEADNFLWAGSGIC